MENEESSLLTFSSYLDSSKLSEFIPIGSRPYLHRPSFWSYHNATTSYPYSASYLRSHFAIGSISLLTQSFDQPSRHSEGSIVLSGVIIVSYFVLHSLLLIC